MCRSSINRRHFLAASAASLPLLAGGSLAIADDPATAGHIDAHAHIWTADLGKYPLADGQTVDDLAPREFTAEQLIELGSKNGVSRYVLIQHRPYHGVDNSILLDAIAAHPGVFSAVACIDESSPGALAEMDRLAAGGVRGFRIRPDEGGADRWIDSPTMCAMWQHAGERGLAICPLIDPDFIPQVAAMADQYPDTTVVVDHFARIGMAGPIRELDVETLVNLSHRPRVHLKVSAFYALGEKKPPYHDLIPLARRMFDVFGPQRLLWGSDSPYQLTEPNSYEASLELVNAGLDFLTADDRQWLLRGTAEKVFFQPLAGA
jgi:predicted TIM-barrel fold metal-dependent hydrolase